jgi:hypothetical protein
LSGDRVSDSNRQQTDGHQCPQSAARQEHDKRVSLTEIHAGKAPESALRARAESSCEFKKAK